MIALPSSFAPDAPDTYGVRCGDCGSPMELRANGFRGRGFWSCSRYPECTGTHGAHPDGRPLGIPANRETRVARIEAHRVFDAAWRARGMTKREAYRWLEEILGVDHEHAHIAKMSAAQCRTLVETIRLAEAARECLAEVAG